MENYTIMVSSKDFDFINANYHNKGKRKKKLVVDNDKKIAIFKYQGNDYLCSEACSEKLSYEIAKVLGYECARIELAVDHNNELGILNYLFADQIEREHTDAIAYLNNNREERAKYYKISNIKKELDKLDVLLFKDFLKIMVFDALIGEQDRHEENWGILKIKGKYKISPLYDNGCSLLREFKNELYAEKFYKGIKNFDVFINNSHTYFYHENKPKKYKHFELIKYLNNLYYDDMQEELNNLRKLKDNIIIDIVNKIPNDLLTKKHKEYIIMYLIKRRDILLNIK